MEATHSITVTEELLLREDFSYKKNALRKHLDQMEKSDTEFFTLVHKIFIDEGQKGEIVDEMVQKTKRLEVRNRNLLSDTHFKIGQVVNRFNEQVDEMKQQQVTITYENMFAMK